ncbi:TonB-dependent receptor [Oceanihabitans sp. IOP_32]|uniref:TonB-dependent receptor n=1 Tax=Oceanihabitans sp. IOP_32 TaxID=2529032 RepID=UPI001293E593|nr:TonB-dependent receptor [Oceanihabitans sp. IOP_32]QFZ53818.1 TonB-dependent receptor [Oceanihabitans sp. IOP_32]
MKSISFIIFFMCLCSAHSQSITGTVTNEKNNQPIPNVEVTLSPSSRKTTTDSNGKFTFKDLEQNYYTVYFYLEGFKYNQKAVELNTNEQVVVDIQLNSFDVSLEEILLFATPTQPTKKIEDALHTGTKITRKGLELVGVSGNNNIYNVLNIVPSVSVQSADAYGLSETDMRIRGVSDYYSGTTTDGIPNYGISPVGARNDIYDAENLESITLHKGAIPADVFSANGNRGGSIDIRYKRPTKVAEIETKQSYGTDDFKRTFLRLDSKELKTNTSAFISYSYTEAQKWKGLGVLGERNHVTAGVNQKLGDKLELELMYNYNDVFKHNLRGFNYGQIQDYKDNYTLDFNDELTGVLAQDRFYFDYNKGDFKNHLSIASLNYTKDRSNKGSFKVYYTKEEADYSFTRGSGMQPMKRDNTRDLSQIGITANWSGKISDYNYAFGYWFESFESDLNTKDYFILSDGLEFKWRNNYKSVSDGNTTIHNPYVKLSRSFNKFKAQVGLRYMYNQEPGTERFLSTAIDAYSPTSDPDLNTKKLKHDAFLTSVGIGYKFSNNLDMYLNYGRSYMRPYKYGPTFNTYLNNRDVFLANNMTYQSLMDSYEMETSDNFDLGINFTKNKVKIYATAFYNKQQNLISNILDPTINVNYNQNSGTVTGYGLELETYFNFYKNWVYFLHPSYTKMTYDENMSFVRGGNIETILIKDNQLPATPSEMVKTGIMYNKNGLSFNAAMTYTGERFGDATNIEKVSDFTVFDAAIKYNTKFNKVLSSCSFSLEMKNVLDRKYIGIVSAWDDGQNGSASYFFGAPRTIVGSITIML